MLYCSSFSFCCKSFFLICGRILSHLINGTVCFCLLLHWSVVQRSELCVLLVWENLCSYSDLPDSMQIRFCVTQQRFLIVKRGVGAHLVGHPASWSYAGQDCAPCLPVIHIPTPSVYRHNKQASWRGNQIPHQGQPFTPVTQRFPLILPLNIVHIVVGLIEGICPILHPYCHVSPTPPPCIHSIFHCHVRAPFLWMLNWN